MTRQPLAGRGRGREFGWSGRPRPDVEPGWLERLQERAARVFYDAAFQFREASERWNYLETRGARPV